MRMRELVMVTTTAIGFGVGGAGCKSGPETKGETARAVTSQPAAAEEGSGNSEGAVAGAATPDQIEAVDMFFRQKAKRLQFQCYNSEVDKTHRKYEGNITISVMVLPGGKMKDAKLINNTLRSLDKEREVSSGRSRLK